MIPLSDDNPTLRTPVMTLAILAVTWLSWLLVQGAGVDVTKMAHSICDLGLVPGKLTGRAPVGTAVPIGPGLECVVDTLRPNYLTPLTSIFLHGSWIHILGNSLFFWVFGNNVEDVMGRARFLAFYLLCGLAAAAAHVAVHPQSAIPTVGASGAISGVMGAYLVLYPRARVNMLFGFWLIPVHAWLVLIYWFALQVYAGLPELSRLSPDVSAGVAVWAHVGGFVTGVVLIFVLKDPGLVALHRQRFGAISGEVNAP